MKKAIIFILLLALALFTIVADNLYSNSDPFTVYGYYNPGQITKTISLSIFKPGTQTKVSNTGTIDWTKPNSGYEDVFDWKATGNFNGNVTISFTVTPLMALLDGYYYIPAHSIKSSTANSNLDVDSTDFTGNPLIATFTSGHSRNVESLDYRSRTIVYSGSEEAPLNSSWSESGTFALDVTDYNQLYGGTFNYISTVTVELTVDAVNQGGGQ